LISPADCAYHWQLREQNFLASDVVACQVLEHTMQVYVILREAIRHDEQFPSLFLEEIFKEQILQYLNFDLERQLLLQNFAVLACDIGLQNRLPH
jgi:hypothetical protein